MHSAERFIIIIITFTFMCKEIQKIQKITSGDYIFQRTILLAYFWHGLSSEGLTYGGKFAFKNRLG